MPPKDNKTQNTNQPLTYKQLQDINAKYFPQLNINEWDDYAKLKRQGHTDDKIRRFRKDKLFKQAFGTREDYNELKQKSAAERDALYLQNYLFQNDKKQYLSYIKELNPDRTDEIDAAWKNLEKESRIEFYNNANPVQRRDLVKYAVRDLLYAGNMYYGVGSEPQSAFINDNNSRTAYTNARWAKGYLEHFSEYPIDIQAQALQYTGYSFDDLEDSKTFAKVANERNKGGYNKKIKTPSIWNITGVTNDEIEVSGTALEYMQKSFRTDVLSNAKRCVEYKLPVTPKEADLYNQYIKEKTEKELPYYYIKDDFIYSPYDAELIYYERNKTEEKLKELNKKVDEARADVIKRNLVIPYTNNPYIYGNLTLENFKQVVLQIAPEYEKYGGSKWAPDYEINYEQLYEELKEYIESGQVGYASDYLTKHIENILSKNQAGWFESGDDLLPSKREVFFRGLAGKTVESILNVFAEPLGGIYGLGAMLTGENFWEAQAVLPNISHNIYKEIKGENSVIFSQGTLSDDIAESSETFGAAIALIGEMATTKKIGGSFKNIEKGSKFNKYASTFLALEAGIDEASSDAFDVKEAILKKGAEEKNNLINTKYNEFIQRFDPNRPYDVDKADEIYLDLFNKHGSELFNEIKNDPRQLDANYIDLRTDADINAEVNERLKIMAIAQAQSEYWFDQNNQGYDDYVRHQANTSYGRTLIEEAAIVDISTLLGLGVNARIVPTRMVKPTSWPIVNQLAKGATKFENTLINSGKLGRATVYTGKLVGKTATTVSSEIFEELGQAHISGFQQKRAEMNIENYAKGLYFGFGTEMLAAQELGFLQGIMDIGPKAWKEVDKEDIIRQTAITTLLLGGFGGSGKARAQISADNRTKIGEVFDYIRKYFPYHSILGNIMEEVKYDVYEKPNIVKNSFENYYNDAKNTEMRQSIAAAVNVGAQMIKAAEEGNVEEYQKQAGAFQISLGIMLDYLNKNDPKYAKQFVEVLQNRANAKTLNQEEQESILQQWIDEASTNDIKNASREEQLDFMVSSSQEVLNLMKESERVRKKLEENEDFKNIDIRPLIFGELLNNLSPKIINDNWKQVVGVVDKVLSDNTSNDKFKSPAYQYIIDNYLKEIDFNKRLDTLTNINKGNIKDIKKEDLVSALDDVLNKVSMELPNARNVVKSDVNLAKWRGDVYKEWLNIYNKSIKGEGVVSEKEKESVLNNLKERFNRRKGRNKFVSDLTRAKTVSDVYKAYTSAKEDSDVKFDVDETVNSIENKDVKDKLNTVKDIIRAKNSLLVGIYRQNFEEPIKSKLIEQLDEIAMNSNSVKELFDISKYNFTGVRPDLIDEMAGKMQNAINYANSVYGTSQTVDTAPKKEQKSTPNATTSEDLTDPSINTAPPVNSEPVTKYTKQESDNIVKDIVSLMKSEGDHIDEINKKIDDLKMRCPDGYMVIVGGNNIVLKKIETNTIVNEADDEELNDDIESSVVNETIHAVDEAQEDVHEEQNPEPVEYPDNDIRSITRVALGKFKPNGKIYAFPVRDEQVDNNTKAKASYTTKELDDNGQEVDVTYTEETMEPLHTVSVEEYNNMVKQDASKYMPIEQLVTYSRPIFVNPETNQEVEKIEVNKAPKQVKNNRTKSQQDRVDNEITPARNEISTQFLPQNRNQNQAIESDKIFTRLGDVKYKNIDQKLEDNGAFEYRNSAALQIGDKIFFIVTQEEMPDGKTEVVIWEVTDNKSGELSKDNGFQGKQVLSVLDQTNAGGKRAELIQRIREAYDKAGKPETFLYDQEQFEVTGIIDGIIPFQITNPTEAIQDSTIEANNLNKAFTKSNGKYGTKFWSNKKGKFIHVPVILRQTKVSPNGTTETITTRDIKEVSVIKHRVASDSDVKDVTIVVPTATGYKATHSVYVLKRGIDGAIEKYIDKIKNGSLGKFLMSRIDNRVNTNGSAKTGFGDILQFARNVSEYVKYDAVHHRLDLGFTKEGVNTILLHAINKEGKWVITEDDARIILDDNQGKGFSKEEIYKEYLSRLFNNEEAEISLTINMGAIKRDEVDSSSIQKILYTLIDDGFLWTPNSIGNRVGMENTGFVASLNDEYREEPVKVEKEPANTLKTAPMASNLRPESIKPLTAKREPENINTTSGSTMRVKRAKLKASDTKKADVKPTTAEQQQSPNALNSKIDKTASLNYDQLTDIDKKNISSKDISKQEWDSLSKEERINVLNCIG